MCDRKRDRFWVRLSLESMKYLIFLFPCADNETKCDLKTLYLTRNVPRIRWKVWNSSVLIRVVSYSAM